MTKRTEKEEPRPRRLLLYVGVREVGKKLRHAYLAVGASWRERDFPTDPLAQLVADDLLLYGKRFGFCRPGTVISMEHAREDDGTVYRHSANVVGHIDDRTAAAWRATSDATKMAHDIFTKAKKDGARDAQLELLEPLHVAYRALRNRNQRTVFLARVMAYITG